MIRQRQLRFLKKGGRPGASLVVLWVRLCAARAGLGVLPSGGLSTIADFRRAYIMLLNKDLV